MPTSVQIPEVFLQSVIPDLSVYLDSTSKSTLRINTQYFELGNFFDKRVAVISEDDFETEDTIELSLSQTVKGRYIFMEHYQQQQQPRKLTFCEILAFAKPQSEDDGEYCNSKYKDHSSRYYKFIRYVVCMWCYGDRIMTTVNVICAIVKHRVIL